MRIAIAADHNAVAMKTRLSSWLTERGHTVERSAGSTTTPSSSTIRSCARTVGARVVNGVDDFGLILGGSAAVNRLRPTRSAVFGRRCATACSPRRSRGPTTNANVLVMGAKVVAPDLAERY